jgi:hypothetical protein
MLRRYHLGDAFWVVSGALVRALLVMVYPLVPSSSNNKSSLHSLNASWTSLMSFLRLTSSPLRQSYLEY